MNEIKNKFSLAEEKCILPMRLRQLKFTYSLVDHLVKPKK